MPLNEANILTLTGGVGLKARVQHPKFHERKDRADHHWFFRPWVDEAQPDGTVKAVQKYFRLCASANEASRIVGHAGVAITAEYTFVDLEGQNETTRAIQDRLATTRNYQNQKSPQSLGSEVPPTAVSHPEENLQLEQMPATNRLIQ